MPNEKNILERGKLPPNALDLEELIIGAILVDKTGMYEVVGMLTPECFYNPVNSAIYSAAFDLFKRNHPIDLITVSNQLRNEGKLESIGGDYHIIQLSQKVSSAAHIQYHSIVVLEKYIKRKSIHICHDIITNAYKDDVDPLDLMENIYRDFGDITELITNKSTKDFKTSVREYFKKKENSRSGIPSSISKMNTTLNGYQKTDLIVIAARPGAGKTAFALNEALECALNGIPVAFFSLEMGIDQLIGRLLSIISGINVKQIITNSLSESEKNYLEECRVLLESLPIEIDDASGLSPLELKLKLSRFKKEKGVEIVFIDYLQLMKIKDKKSFNKEQEVSEISASLKSMAKELDIPVIALSQLSRAVETRGGNKRPMLSDLRDSGAIEQDADVVIFIYRPEYYKIEHWDDDEGGSTENQADLEIAKHRNGETKFIRAGCMLRYMRFMDIDKLHDDLTHKYFRKSIPQNKPELIPLMSPENAFDDPIPF